jgi:hypothetical protein
MSDHTYLHTQDATWRPAVVRSRSVSCSLVIPGANATEMPAKPGTRGHFPGLTTTRRRVPL